MKFKAALLGLILLPAGAVTAQEQSEWEWTLAPYLWATSAGLDLSVNDQEVIGGEADFRDLVDKVDMVFLGYFEARKGRWGAYLDTVFFDLSDNKSLPVGPGGPILGDVYADARLKIKLYNAGGLYRLSAPDAAVRFDLLAGLRYVDMDVDAQITLPGPGMTEVSVQMGPAETDLMLGGRLYGEFSDHWFWNLRGDFSFGGTAGTYNAFASLGYKFGQSGPFSMNLGYRYMSIDIDGKTRMDRPGTAAVTMSGPMLGFIFKF